MNATDQPAGRMLVTVAEIAGHAQDEVIQHLAEKESDHAQ
jgi:hypothetical protein